MKKKMLKAIHSAGDEVSNVFNGKESAKLRTFANGAIKQDIRYNSCPHCGSTNISVKHNGAGRKKEVAKNILIEPLTCEECYAAVTRFYRINCSNGQIKLEYVMSNSINIDN